MAAFDEKKSDHTKIDCVMSGYLMKQSLYLKQFRKRWIVLKRDKCLYSYKTDKINKEEPTEIIDLEQFQYFTCERARKNQQFLITLTSSNEKTERVFTTQNKQEIIAWFKAIQTATNNQLQPLLKTKLAKTERDKKELIKFKVETKEGLGYEEKRWNCDFSIRALYSEQEKLGNVLTEIEKQLSHKYKPLKLKVDYFGGFTGYVDCQNMNPIMNKPITAYSKSDIITKGLSVCVRVKYEHKVKDVVVSCEYMKEKKTNNPLQCPVYYAMKKQYEFSEKNLQHVNEYSHFVNEYEEKPQCKYAQDCKAYIRSEKGSNRLDDNCHMKIYRHPPRTRNIKLAQNMHSLIINKNYEENHAVYWPTDEDKQKYYSDKDGYLKALIEEVINNGYKYDLCLECKEGDECKHDEYSILQVVDDKLKHIRHKAMDSPLTRELMLSLILYTGCDCNYDLCASQRKGNYKKWKWFDCCLYWAIWKLSNNETGSFNVYSGLNAVKLEKKKVESGHFVTYVSSSWNKEVAKRFMSGDGMVMQIDKTYKNEKNVFCCDVSWISKFPDECEILFARSSGRSYNKFNCIVLDESNGVQTVSLKCGWK